MEDPEKTWPPIKPIPPRSELFSRALAFWLFVVGVIVAAFVLIVKR